MGCTEIVDREDKVMGWICRDTSTSRATDISQWKWCVGCGFWTEKTWTVFLSDNPWYEPTTSWVCSNGQHR